MSNESLVIPLEELCVDDKLHFVEEPIEVMDREIKQLKRSRIPIIKVRWNSKRGPEFTWEREDQFKQKYPHLFTKNAPSSSAAFAMSSDNASSTVTYTSVSSDSNGPSSWGIPLVNADIYGYGPIQEPMLMMLHTTAESPVSIADSISIEEDTNADSIDYPDELEDGEEDDDEDPEDDPSEEHEPEDDDDDDDTDDEDEEPTKDEEEEEHLAPADSSIVPIVDHVPSAGITRGI
ncbi:hypothetical protein Tco_0157548 [Tanacetum coccineum]